MSSTEYKPPAGFDLSALQQVWSPQDHRDTVRDVMQLAALKQLHRQVDVGLSIWDSIVVERALLGTLPKPIRTPQVEPLFADWPARIVCAVVCP